VRTVRAGCLISIALLLSAWAARAATLAVPAQYPTIGAALAAATAGDVVELADGVYQGPGNRDLDFHGKAITVRSQSGDPSACIIDCAGGPVQPHRGFWFHSGEDSLSVLRGVSIVGGYASDSGAGILCGAISPAGNASPLIEDCVVANHTAAQGAGLSVIAMGSAPLIRRCVFNANTGPGASWSHDANAPEIRDCVFSCNSGPGITLEGVWTASVFRLESCAVENNGGDGLRSAAAFARLSVSGCRIAENAGWGLYSAGTQDVVVSLDGTLFTANGLGGIEARSDHWTTIEDCVVRDNLGDGLSLTFAQTISRTVVRGNAGHGVYFNASGARSEDPERQPYCDILECDLSFNGGCGVRVAGSISHATVAGCTVLGNGADGIGLAATCAHGSCYYGIYGNTVSGNAGSGLARDSSIPCQMGQNVIAFNGALGISSASPAGLNLSCGDIYGNRAGDWVGPIADRLGVAGNFCANPLFCDVPDTLYTLAANSPCLPENNPSGCERIGAATAGCGAITFSPDRVALTALGPARAHPGEALTLRVAILDSTGAPVPDEGAPPAVTALAGLGATGAPVLQPDLSWSVRYAAGPLAGRDSCRAHDPEAASQPSDTLAVEITERAILESVADVPDDQGLFVRLDFARDLYDAPGSAAPITFYRAWRRAARASWEPVGPDIPATQSEHYATVVPTPADSTALGVPYSVFFVSAHTADPQLFFDSAPDSGYSVDNLRPATPSGFTVTYDSTAARLLWLPNPDPDLALYRVYRAATPDFAIGPETLAHSTTGTGWLDDTRPDPWNWFYRITAVDDAGLESDPASPGPHTAVPDPSDRPRAALVRLAPNPARPPARVRYDVPAGGAEISLEIFDPQGRLVRTLVAGRVAGGRHEISWEGKDETGRRAPAGVYLCRLRAAGVERTARLTLAP
jgi:hypothetical protein